MLSSQVLFFSLVRGRRRFRSLTREREGGRDEGEIAHFCIAVKRGGGFPDTLSNILRDNIILTFGFSRYA